MKFISPMCCAALAATVSALAAEAEPPTVPPPADLSGRTVVLSAAKRETVTPQAVVGPAESHTSASSFRGLAVTIGPKNGTTGKPHVTPVYEVKPNHGVISYFDNKSGDCYIVLTFTSETEGTATIRYELPGAVRYHSGIHFVIQ